MVNILEVASKVLSKEQEGIAAITEVLDDNFVEIVNSLYKIKGKVIISGMGKSGHIGKKIAATLASIGTPSFFVHPGEASHGDLGMIGTDDAIILLSNSGETKELVDIINYAKRYDILLIGIVRRKSSMLVKAANYSIVLPDVSEASSVNAPTTSTTMMLVLGDLIAVAIAELKGFNKESFGIFHPGGKIGSEFIQVSEIMRTGEKIPLVDSDVKLSKAIIEMSEKGMGCVGIIDQNKEFVGIITDGDLRRHLDFSREEPKVLEVMTKSPLTIDPESLAQSAVAIMQNKKITMLFVLKDNKPVGALNIHDCFQAGLL